MLRKLARLFFVVCWAIGLWLLWGQWALAQGLPTSSIDFSRVTFDSLPAFEQPGQIESITDEQVRSDIGYDPGRSWDSGTRPADVFKVGDFQSSLNAQSLNLDQIGELSGLNMNELTLSEVPLFQEMSLKDLVDAVPSLEAFTVAEVPGLTDILGGNPDTLLGDLVSTDQLIGNLNVGDYLGDLKISDIPNLSLTELDGFKDWQNFEISDVPGLKDVEWGSLSNAVAVMSGVTGTHDVTYGPKEHRQTPTKFSITGGDQVGFSIQCAQARGCAYIELEGMGKMHGAQWIAGGRGEGQQMVKGGFGPLAVVNGGQEPTGRHPFGDEFKIVLTSTDEAEGTGQFSLYFKICVTTIYGRTCTPYFLGPVPMPLLDSKEKGMVITGLLDLLGGSTSGLQAPKSWEAMRPAPDAETQAFINSVGKPEGRRGRGRSLCGEGPGGVDFNSLASVFSSIEGDYDSVGAFDCDRDGNCGRGLGRYQYMSYRSDVRAEIEKVAGGKDFLAKLDSGATIGRSEAEYFFSPAAQDAIFQTDQTENINQAMAEGFTGSRLIERVGQIHFGGSGAKIDGTATDIHGRLNLKTYGQQLAQEYQNLAVAESAECQPGGLIAGRSIEDAIAYEQAGFQDFDAYRAYRNGYHAGIDFDYRFGADEGGEVVALVGGEVVDYYAIAQNRRTGEGSVSVVISTADSEGREITVLYTHLSESSVADSVEIGGSVAPGQTIGAVGGEDSVSKGAHLDLKVQVDGVYVDPDEFMQAVIDGGGTVTTIDVATGVQGTTQVGEVK